MGRNHVKVGAMCPVVELLQRDDRAHVCIFVNFKSDVGKFTSSLEDLMAKILLCAGVLLINGDMNKHKKHSTYTFFQLRASQILSF